MRPNRDVIINSSILILAIVIVIERIISVDTGIRYKRLVANEKGRIADGCMLLQRAGFHADKSARPFKFTFSHHHIDSYYLVHIIYFQ